MGFQKRRGELILALVVALIIFGLQGKCCRAALIVKSNTTYECKGNGRLDDCRIAEDLQLELDNLEFLMNPNVVRILQGGSNGHPGIKAGNAHQSVCGTAAGQPYGKKCIPPTPGKSNHGCDKKDTKYRC